MTRLPLEFHIGTRDFHFFSQTKKESDIFQNYHRFMTLTNMEVPLSAKFVDSNIVTLIIINYLKDDDEILKARQDLYKKNYQPVGNINLPLGIGVADSVYRDENNNNFFIVAHDRVLFDYNDIILINHPCRNVLKNYLIAKKEPIRTFYEGIATGALGNFKDDKYFTKTFNDTQNMKVNLRAVTGHCHGKNNDIIYLYNDKEVFSEFEYILKDVEKKEDDWDLIGSFIQLFRKGEEKIKVEGTQYSADAKSIGGIIVEPSKNFFGAYFEITHQCKNNHHNRLGFFTTLEPDSKGISCSKFSLVTLLNLVYFLKKFESEANSYYDPNKFITNVTSHLNRHLKA